MKPEVLRKRRASRQSCFEKPLTNLHRVMGDLVTARPELVQSNMLST